MYGANEACALKLALASGLAVETALLARYNPELTTRNGIIGSSMKESLDNLGLLSRSTKETERTVLKIMLAES